MGLWLEDLSKSLSTANGESYSPFASTSDVRLPPVVQRQIVVFDHHLACLVVTKSETYRRYHKGSPDEANHEGGHIGPSSNHVSCS